MRGVAITWRARGGHSFARNFSAGIGRGRGQAPGKYDDAEESLFGASVGHGAPLNAGFSGRGVPLNPPSRASGAPTIGSGIPPAGRGFNNLNRTHPSETPYPSSGPLSSENAFGRGYILHNQGEDPYSAAKPMASRPSLNLGSGSFGRGKLVEKSESPEDIFSSDRRSVLSSWSKWNEKLSKIDAENGPSPAELRLLQDEESASDLPFPRIPQQQSGQQGQERQKQAFQSSASGSPHRAASVQQWPPGSPGQQPLQWSNFAGTMSPKYKALPAGQQQPVQQQPYYDSRLQQQPSIQYAPPPTGRLQSVQQPYHDGKVPPQPPLQYATPSTGPQHYDARVQPQPSVQHTGPSTDPNLNLDWQQPVQQPHHDARVQLQPAMRYPASPTAFEPSASASPFQAAAPQQSPPPGSPGRQPMLQFNRSDTMNPSYSTPLAGLQQPAQQPLYGASVQSGPSVQQTPLSKGYDYEWGPPSSESLHVSKEQQQMTASMYGGDPGIDYEGKIEDYFQQSKLEEIDGIYSEMKAAQVQPSAKTYGTILQSYLQLGKMDKVSLIYKEMSGALFSEEKPKAGKVEETSTATTTHSVGVTASLSETSSSGQGAQHDGKDEEDEEFTPSRSKDTGSTSLDTHAPRLASFGRVEPSVGTGMGRGKRLDSSPETGVGRGRMDIISGTGMGRGKKVESFFNFDFSGSLRLGDRGMDAGKQSVEADKESKKEVQDDYSQTFTPVIEPGWYAFAPEGLSVGPGAGRGRSESPQARGLGLGTRSHPDQDSTSYERRLQAALQKAPPLYAFDSRSLPAEPEYKDPDEEPAESTLSEEEAAERAMKILNARMERAISWGRTFEETGFEKRRSLQLAQSLSQRKQPKVGLQVEKEVHLTEEEQKKEAEHLKAMEESETLRELQHTFDQFMKCYGEMALEPEHELGDFTNPDIEEKPFMPLDEYLEKAKPNIMKTGLIRGEKEWQDMVKETMRHLPYYEEFVERYSGPGRYTAKQENEDLEEIAATLPPDTGRAAKAFVQRGLTTLKSNPAFNLQQKQWLLASMVDEFSEFIVND